MVSNKLFRFFEDSSGSFFLFNDEVGINWEDKPYILLEGENCMNKQSMWFLTLFSLILVLSVYYITMPNELLLSNHSNYNSEGVMQQEEEQTEANVVIEECEEIVALRVSHDDAILQEIQALQVMMTNDKKTAEEKNEAYEQIQYLTTLQGKEEKIEAKLKNVYKIDNFVEIDNTVVKVVVAKKEHDVNLANDIMKTVQEEFESKMYITVKFATN